MRNWFRVVGARGRCRVGEKVLGSKVWREREVERLTPAVEGRAVCEPSDLVDAIVLVGVGSLAVAGPYKLSDVFIPMVISFVGI